MEPVIFMFCLTLHNVEEVLCVTAWGMEMPHAGRMPEKKAFVFAVFGITVLGYFSAGLFALFPGNAYADYAFVGFAGALLVNALVPHLFFTIRCRKYCPGVLTGCFLILPFHGIILHNAATTRLPLAAILLSTLLVGAALLLCIIALKRIAKTMPLSK